MEEKGEALLQERTIVHLVGAEMSRNEQKMNPLGGVSRVLEVNEASIHSDSHEVSN